VGMGGAVEVGAVAPTSEFLAKPNTKISL